jgi:hypothetical protein
MNNRAEQIKAEIDRAKWPKEHKEMAIKLLLDGWVRDNCPNASPADAAEEALQEAEATLVDGWERVQWGAHCRDQIGPLTSPGLMQPKDLLY